MVNSNHVKKNIEKKKWNILRNWLINYIPEPIRKIVACFKNRVVSLFNTNTPKQCMYDKGKKLSKPKKQKKKAKDKN